MKNLSILVLGLGAAFFLTVAPVQAQRGRTGGVGGGDVKDNHTNSSTSNNGSAKSDAKPSTKPATFEDRIEANPKLADKLKTMLPPNTTLKDAALGFKNEGQFIAALHVSKNLNIPFDQLKAKMVGPNAESLGKAIHDLRPDLAPQQANAEAKKAEKEAKETEHVGKPA
jgi:hypothetical protein